MGYYSNYAINTNTGGKLGKTQVSNAASKDRIDISKQAEFRSKLDQELKSNRTSYINEINLSEKIEALKEKYRDDRCPIEANKLAQSILSCVCGINSIGEEGIADHE